MPPTPKLWKSENENLQNILFWKVLSKTGFRFEFSVKNYVFQHRTKNTFLKNVKNWGFKLQHLIENDVGSVKKRFLMVQSCLEHIPKLILIGKSLANYLNNWSRSSFFSTLYGYIDVFYVCILCMYSMYVFHVCILCMYTMYSIHVLYVLDVCTLCV